MKSEIGKQMISRPSKFSKMGQRQQKVYDEMMKQRKETDSLDLTDIKSKNLFRNIPISQSKKQSLFDKLKRYERKLMSELMDEIELLESTRRNIKNLRTSIKRIHEDIKKGFSEVSHSMSFVHKRQKNSYYIKCRFWWDGGTDGKKGQREVSVCSIPDVIDEFNMNIENENEGFPKRKLSDKLKDISWDEFKQNTKLMRLLRIVSKPRVRSYIVNKLQTRRTLGYRIRTKNMTGTHRLTDTGYITSNDVEFTDEEIKQIKLRYGKKLNDTDWYREIEKL
tara:strand:- start:179 stop:1015 length:837 start_codon:yes stop_codon:yes gene_type:complete